MTVWAYIDGFNLYYRAIREAQKKGLGNQRWLDLVALVRRLASPKDQVAKVKYFTAEVLYDPRDPGQQQRQRDYWDALETLSEVEIILGQFRADKKTYPRWDSYQKMLKNTGRGALKYAIVWKPEEKGSDVNLATHLVHDAHEGCFDKAVVFSNDSDLKEAVRLVVSEIGRTVVVCNPSNEAPFASLRGTASQVRRLRPSVLAACQLPDPVTDPKTGRTIDKPQEWK